MRTPSVRTRLHQRVVALHRALGTASLANALMSPSVELRDVRDFFEVVAAAYKGIEAGEALSGYALLRDDLKALGGDIATVLALDMPELSAPPEQMGMRYVLLGVQHAGKLIDQAIRQHLDDLPELGFFSPSLERIELWQTLLHDLDQLRDCEIEGAIRGAEQTMSCIFRELLAKRNELPDSSIHEVDDL